MTVSYRLTDGVAVLTLADPRRHNALSRTIVLELNRLLTRSREEGAHALVLAGEGPSFCAGANMDDLRTGWMEPGGDPQQDPVHVFRRLAQDPRPTLAAVHGVAAGGGMELTLACDLVIAGPQARFLAPELAHGVVPPLGLALLPQVVGRHRAMELMLTRRAVAAPEALALGLATHAAEGEDIVAEAVALARSIVAAVPPGALAVAKRHMARYHGPDWEAVLASSAEVPRAEWREGLDAYMAKRRPDYARFWAAAGGDAT